MKVVITLLILVVSVAAQQPWQAWGNWHPTKVEDYGLTRRERKIEQARKKQLARDFQVPRREERVDADCQRTQVNVIYERDTRRQQPSEHRELGHVFERLSDLNGPCIARK